MSDRIFDLIIRLCRFPIKANVFNLSNTTFYWIAGVSLLTIIVVLSASFFSGFARAAHAKEIIYAGDGKRLQPLPSWLKDSSAALFSGTTDAPLSSGNIVVVNYNPIITDAVHTEFVIGGLSESGDVARNSVTLLNGRCVFMLHGGSGYDGIVSDNCVIIKGGSVDGELYGGNSERGDAVGNTVTISGASLKKHVCGGYSNVGSVTKNKVIVSGGFFGEEITGGFCYNGDAVGNTVAMSGGAVRQDVSGGYSDESDAADNAVTISGGFVGKSVVGGYCDTFSASGNTVTISGGSVGSNVLGGSSRKGNAKSNAVIINGGFVGEAVYGGHSDGCGSASGNTVTISGNPSLTKINIYGGFNVGKSHDGDDISGNTVTISGNPNLAESNIYGGFHENGDEGALTGNILNFKSLGISAGSVSNFEYYNFYLPESTVPGAVMLSVTEQVDLKGTTAEIFLQGGTKLRKGDKVTLIHSAECVSDAPENKSCEAQHEGVLYEFSIYTDSNNLWAEVTKVSNAA